MSADKILPRVESLRDSEAERHGELIAALRTISVDEILANQQGAIVKFFQVARRHGYVVAPSRSGGFIVIMPDGAKFYYPSGLTPTPVSRVEPFR